MNDAIVGIIFVIVVALFGAVVSYPKSYDKGYRKAMLKSAELGCAIYEPENLRY